MSLGGLIWIILTVFVIATSLRFWSSLSIVETLFVTFAAAVLAWALLRKRSEPFRMGVSLPERNIYGERLVACNSKKGLTDSSVNDGTCSEASGGVHQICAKDIGRPGVNFSSVTGQGGWSDNRKNVNHCLCLGAWANYAAKRPQHDIELKCEAIPETVFDSSYLRKWSRWNDVTVSGQAKVGLDNLYAGCARHANPTQLRYLNGLKVNLAMHKD